ncbi:hypothetical protein J0A68_18795 [Algoriphagus sp. H41]|uniref:Uncharacterized protein n=1 Tax=Algoriphagus oliviformis TaxID=2811231 RepID=A0ABS3C7C7_9BACT|nr:hypothetical protein [Algoriphagus oliviformis]MBN7813012.1 hypothetical protein [Algoriphagus oliviformis]
MKKGKSETTTESIDSQYSEINEAYASKWRTLELFIPSNFRMLCAILDIKPERVLMDFMWKLSYSYISGTTEKQRRAGRKFFLSCQYGRPYYSEKQIRQLFAELKANLKICDTSQEMEDLEKELFWKSNHMYIEFWFKRWFEQNGRKIEQSTLEIL